MHPAGDEILYLLSGKIDLILENNEALGNRQPKCREGGYRSRRNLAYGEDP